MKRIIIAYLPAVAFVATVYVLVVYADSLMVLKDQMGEASLLGYAAYVLSLIIAIVAMPVTVMPLIPMATMVFGPFTTAILSIIGWTLGGLLAFLVARHLGRPVIERFASLEKVDNLAKKGGSPTNGIMLITKSPVLAADNLG